MPSRHREPLMPSSNPPGTVARDALKSLQSLRKRLRQATAALPPPPFAALRTVVADLGRRATFGHRRCPAAYVLDWQAYLAEQQACVSARAVRSLAWEPPVATDGRFLAYLEATPEIHSPQVLCGLVWSCHVQWSTALAARPVLQRIRQHLEAYEGDHGLLTQWRQTAEVLLSPQGPGHLAAILLEHQLPITALCHTWGLDVQTPYVLAVMRQAVRLCWQAMEESPALRVYLVNVLFPWMGWSESDIRLILGTTVLHPVTSVTPGMAESVLRQCLADARLGDPRLPAQQPRWKDIPAAARLRVGQWLTEADLHLFFTQVFPTCKDQAERHRFWQRYVPRVLRSRILFHEADVPRLQPVLAHIPEQMPHCGTLHGASSALILDLGAAVVVQVSEVSAPCYVYGARSFAQLVPDFWQTQPFAAADLLVTAQAALVPYHQHWEKDLAETFALCDIHPTYREAA